MDSDSTTINTHSQSILTLASADDGGVTDGEAANQENKLSSSAAAAGRNQPGSSVAVYNCLVFLRRLSSNDYHSVWYCYHYHLQCYVICKVLHRPCDAKDVDSICKRFELERDVLLQLNHPLIVGLCFSFATPDASRLCMVLEATDDGDLSDTLAQYGRLNNERCREILSQLICALHYLHKHNIVHRDIKPENICMKKDGQLKLTDFGLAGVVNSARKLATAQSYQTLRPQTHLYSNVGTHDYVAPEILLGIGHSFEVDWWSLGVLAFEMYYGYKPFHGDTIDDTHSNILDGDIHWPEELKFADNSKEELHDLIKQLLILEPTDRLNGDNGQLQHHPFFSTVNWKSLDSTYDEDDDEFITHPNEEGVATVKPNIFHHSDSHSNPDLDVSPLFFDSQQLDRNPASISIQNAILTEAKSSSTEVSSNMNRMPDRLLSLAQFDETLNSMRSRSTYLFGLPEFDDSSDETESLPEMQSGGDSQFELPINNGYPVHALTINEIHPACLQIEFSVASTIATNLPTSLLHKASPESMANFEFKWPLSSENADQVPALFHSTLSIDSAVTTSVANKWNMMSLITFNEWAGSAVITSGD